MDWPLVLLNTAAPAAEAAKAAAPAKIDPAMASLLGVGIGSLFGFFGNWITGSLNLKREKAQWENNRVDKKIEREYLAEKETDDSINYLRQNIISDASTFKKYKEILGQSSNDPKEIKEISERMIEIYSRLTLNFTKYISMTKDMDRKRDVFYEFYNYIEAPSQFADFAISEVISNIKGSEDKSIKLGQIPFLLSLSNEKLQEDFILGHSNEPYKIVNVDINKLSTSQRKILVEIYPSIIGHNLMPKAPLQLQVPVSKQGSEYTYSPWGTNIVPLDDYKKIFNEWEIEYDKQKKGLKDLS